MTETPFGMGPESRERREAPSRFEAINGEIAELDRRESLSLTERERRRELRDQRAEMGRKAKSLGVLSVAEGALNQVFKEAEKREDPMTYIAQQRELIDSIESGTRKSSVFRLRKGVEKELGGAAAYYFNRGLDHMEVVFLAGGNIEDIKEMVEPEDWEWKMPEGTKEKKSPENQEGEFQRDYRGPGPDQPRGGGQREKLPSIELPSTPEEWLRLVRGQLFDLMIGKYQSVGTWLERTSIQQPGSLPLGDALRHMPKEITEIKYIYLYGGERKETTFREALEKEIMAMEALHKRHGSWVRNAVAPDLLEKILIETEGTGALISPMHFETIATLAPEIKGNRWEGTPLGDVVSQLFHIYREAANRRIKLLPGERDPNIFNQFASEDQIKKTRENARKMVTRETSQEALKYADEIAFRLIRVFGEAAWSDARDVNGPAAPGSDASAQLMHFQRHREKQRDKGENAGPLITLQEGVYPKHLLLPMFRMVQVRDKDGKTRYLSEIFDNTHLLRDISLSWAAGKDHPDKYWLLKVQHAAKLFKRLMDTKGEGIDLNGFQGFIGDVRKGVFDEIVQFEIDPTKGSEYWEKHKDELKGATDKWRVKVRFNYMKGLKWLFTVPRGAMSTADFWFKIAEPAIGAGVITRSDAHLIVGYSPILQGIAYLRNLRQR